MTNPVDDAKLSPSWTVNETLRRYPQSIVILNALGIDTCCGGSETLDVAAREAGVETDALVSALDLTFPSCDIDL